MILTWSEAIPVPTPIPVAEAMKGVGDDEALGRSAYAGSRVSSQRIVIARAADGITSAFSVEDLIEAVRRDAPGIGAATVYRAVAAMEAAGFVEALGTRGGSALYARCRSGGHHHHLVCTGCGAVADAECAMVPASFPAPAGFHITGHDLVLYGECARCRDAAHGPATGVESGGE